ncbi:Fc.00g079510.m01.CDS01 [Cosmosporella sp. VM-42]
MAAAAKKIRATMPPIIPPIMRSTAKLDGDDSLAAAVESGPSELLNPWVIVGEVTSEFV